MKLLHGIFTAILALAGRPQPPELEPTVAAAPDADKSKCMVLAIDDDPQFLAALRPLLIDSGFRVLSATSSPKGLDLLRFASRDIAVVLLDFNMPQLNGAETLQHIRKLSPKVKVIAVTGVNMEALPPSFREGLDGFLAKPYTQAQLIETIHSLVAPPVAVVA